MSCTVTSIADTPPGSPSSACAVCSVTNAVRWLTNLLPRSTRPDTVSVAPAPRRRAVELVADRDAEIGAEVGADHNVLRAEARRRRPFSRRAARCGNSCRLDPLQVHRARGLAAHGERRPGGAGDRGDRASMRSSSTIFCHWSIERMRCSGFCTIAASATSPRSGRAASCGGRSTMWGCEESTRLTMFGLLSGERGRHEDDHGDADRHADDDGHGLQPAFAQESARGDPLERQPVTHAALRARARPAAPARAPAPPPRRARPRADLHPAGAAQAELDRAGAARAVLHPRTQGAAPVASRTASAGSASVRAARHFDVDRDGHILAQIRRRLAHEASLPRCRAARRRPGSCRTRSRRSASPGRRRRKRAPAGPGEGARCCARRPAPRSASRRPARAPSASCPAARRRRARRGAR